MVNYNGGKMNIKRLIPLYQEMIFIKIIKRKIKR